MKSHKNAWLTIMAAAFLSISMLLVLVLFIRMLSASLGIGSQQILTIDSSNGGKIVVTTMGDGMPRIIFFDSNDSETIHITATGTGASSVWLNAPNGNPAIQIDTFQKGYRPRIALFDPETGKEAWSVKVNKDGKAVVDDHSGD